MKRGTLIAVGLIAYALILIVTAPATLIDGFLQRASEGRVRLAAARGTVWSGEGQLAIVDAGRYAGISRKISWHVLAASLMRGGISCEVEPAAAAQPVQLAIFPRRVEIATAEVSAPAALLGIVVPKLAPLGLGGDLFVHIDNLSIGSTAVRGTALIQWRAASSVHAPVAPLGDYELQINASDMQAKFTLRTLDGPLQVQGSGTWTIAGPAEFDATARVSPQYRNQIEPFLRMITVARDDGSFGVHLP
jgi:general secretion pathway protein N